MAAPISVQQLKDASEDATTLSDFINKPENVMIPRRLATDINSLQYYLEYMESYAQKSYETYSEMLANASNLSENVSVFVTNDLDTANNGIYTYNGTGFVKGDYQPENIAKAFVEAKLGGLEVFDGKVRAQDVSTADGSTQDIKNIEIFQGQAAFPFEGSYINVDSFELGATITQRNEALRHTASGKLYRWAGSLPKVVPEGSTPVSSGGVGTNAWLEVSDTVLRQELSSTGGAILVKGAVISVKSIAEMKGFSVPVGTEFSLLDNNRLGSFEVVSGDFTALLTADTYNGIYVGLADDPTGSTKVAKRRYSGAVDVKWFGAIGDYNGTTGTDNTPYIQAALKAGNRLTFGNSGRFKMSGVVGIDNGITLYASDLYIIESHGATLVLDSPEPVFTSQRALATPDSGKDFFTPRVMFQNLIVEQHSPSVMIAGDYIYNSTLRGCSIKGVSTVIKSWKPKGVNYPNGYLQSFSVTGNEFALVGRVIDAKRAYNLTVDSNRFEGCKGGVYIDGTSYGFSVYTCRITNNVFESGGVFAKLANTMATTISNNYFEQNASDDAAPDKLNCLIYAKNPNGNTIHAGLRIENNMVGTNPAQETDKNYADYKLQSNHTVYSSDPILRGNTTTGYRLCDIPLTSAEGTYWGQNNRLSSRVGLSANDAKVNYVARGKVFNAADNLVEGVFTIATISVFRIRQLLLGGVITSAEIPAVFDMSVLVRPRSSSGVVFNNAHVKLSGVLGYASEGMTTGIVNDLYVGLSLVSVTEMPIGEAIRVNSSGSADLYLRNWWIEPKLTLVRSGNIYKVQLSGFSNLAIDSFGEATEVQSFCTLTCNSSNSSDARATLLEVNTD